MNCIIIDDDPVSGNLIKHFVTHTEGLDLLEVFTSPIAGANYIRKNTDTIDLILLDIEMPEMTGLELMASFEDLPPVIFITSKEKYATDAFEHKAVHYLVKPVEYSRFLKAIDRVFKQANSSKDEKMDFLFVKDNSVQKKITHADIQYFQAFGDYVKIFTKDKTYVATISMKSLEDKLSANAYFARVHRSYIINLKFLDNFDHELAVVAGHMVPIGSKYRSSLNRKLQIL